MSECESPAAIAGRVSEDRRQKSLLQQLFYYTCTRLRLLRFFLCT